MNIMTSDNFWVNSMVHPLEFIFITPGTVDRIPVNAAMKIRLGESVSQCLKMGKDLLFVLEEGNLILIGDYKALMDSRFLKDCVSFFRKKI